MVADTIREEEKLYVARQPPPRKAASPPKKAVKPTRTGYEKYAEPSYIPQLEASASIWGVQPKKTATPDQTQQKPISQGPGQSQGQGQGQKMMSLEEVEAMMRAQKQKGPVGAIPQMHPPGIPGTWLCCFNGTDSSNRDQEYQASITPTFLDTLRSLPSNLSTSNFSLLLSRRFCRDHSSQLNVPLRSPSCPPLPRKFPRYYSVKGRLNILLLASKRSEVLHHSLLRIVRLRNPLAKFCRIRIGCLAMANQWHRALLVPYLPQRLRLMPERRLYQVLWPIHSSY